MKMDYNYEAPEINLARHCRGWRNIKTEQVWYDSLLEQIVSSLCFLPFFFRDTGLPVSKKISDKEIQQLKIMYYTTVSATLGWPTSNGHIKQLTSNRSAGAVQQPLHQQAGARTLREHSQDGSARGYREEHR